jgi:hypothetical protein
MGSGSGRVYSVSAADIAPDVTFLQVGTATALNPGVVDTPIVDSTVHTVLATSSNDMSLTSAVVVQADTTNLAQINRLSIGLGSAGGTAVTLYGGDFDNTYITTPASGGSMLVCGTATGTTIPTLYSLSFDSASHMTGVSLPLTALSTVATARCSPITEFYNPNTATDSFFFGVTSQCTAGGGIPSVALPPLQPHRRQARAGSSPTTTVLNPMPPASISRMKQEPALLQSSLRNRGSTEGCQRSDETNLVKLADGRA